MQLEYPAGCTQYGLLRWRLHIYAGIAHLVERHLAKVEVASSSLVARSREKQDIRIGMPCFFIAWGLSPARRGSGAFPLPRPAG